MRDLFIQSDAKFSPCRQYRYQLSRIWDQELPLCAFVMLNPSTADETANDPTSRRCMSFAADWGYGGVIQVNLYALRGSDPKVLLKHIEPVGIDNDHWLRRTCEWAHLVVAAWGANRAVGRREISVTDLLTAVKSLHCLRITASGHPEHPLYLPASLKPQPFNTARAA